MAKRKGSSRAIGPKEKMFDSSVGISTWESMRTGEDRRDEGKPKKQRKASSRVELRRQKLLVREDGGAE